ncbi:MAG: hypothetical protein HRU36_01195 [Rickettsiales bacterium]|nr:hypothetical protein [Rickettsiales bacterium]
MLIPIAIVEAIFALVFLFCGRTKEPNKFGTQPQKASRLEYILTFIFLPLNILMTLAFFASSILEDAI